MGHYVCSRALRAAPRLRGVAAALAVAVVVMASGCAKNSPENAAIGVNDPFEAVNRSVHAFNRGADRVLLRPIAQVYDAATPEIVQISLRNAVSNLEAPRDFANHLLSGELRGAGRTLVRFAINSALGFGGVMDIATRADLPKEDADFAKTLAVWGVDQGVYYEVPLLGPSTVRHTVGRMVDIAFAPTTYVLMPYAGAAQAAVRVFDARAVNAALIDDVLYGSGDSYALTRSVYLQQRDAFVNGGEVNYDTVVPLD